MFLSATTTLQLLPSRSLLLFVLLNPEASSHIQDPSSPLHCLLVASRIPHSLGFPCLTCCSLSVCFPDCSWTLLYGSALGQDMVVRRPPPHTPCFWQSSLPPGSYTVWIQVYPEADRSHVPPAPASLLHSWLVHLLALGKPRPILLALCFLQTLVTNLVAVIFVPSTRMDALQGRFFIYCGIYST